MIHTLLLITLSLFLAGVPGEATLRTHTAGSPLNDTYDGARLCAETWTGNVTHQWLYHGPLTPIAQLDGQGQVVARSVYGSQDHVPDYLLMGEAIYRLVTDQLGSVRLVVNVMTGEVVQRLDYDTWGNVLQDTHPGFQPFGFAGGLYDSFTGLVHFGAREYDPQVGRWTSKDPIGFAGEDTNLYVYVYNNPVNWIDPDGRLAYFVWAIVGAGIEFIVQLKENEGRIECINWWRVGMAAATGAGIGFALRPFTAAQQAVIHWNTAERIGLKTINGLKPGNWVMTGEKTWRNYIMSGVAQKGYKYKDAITVNVPRSSLKYPPGLEQWKGLLGQRKYVP